MKKNLVENIKKENEDFIFALNNFEHIFASHLFSSEENSVDEFFAEVSLDFVKLLRKEINFKKLQNFDKENSVIEVDDEGQCRIELAHKEKLEYLPQNFIEIFIGGGEIMIDLFGITHIHFAVAGNNLYFDKSKKDEDKYEFSEIDWAVESLREAMEFPTKISLTACRGKKVSGTFYNRVDKKTYPVHFLNFCQRLKCLFGGKKEEVFYIDWQPQFAYEKVLSKTEILQKLTDFLENKISRQKLADCAVDIFNAYDEHRINYEHPDFDELVYALTFADAGINEVLDNQKVVHSEMAKRIFSIFEEKSENLSKEEVKKMVNWLKML